MRKSSKKKGDVDRDLFPLTPEERLLLEAFYEDLELCLILLDGQLFGPCNEKRAQRIVRDLSALTLKRDVSLIRLKTNKLGTAEEVESLWVSACKK